MTGKVAWVEVIGQDTEKLRGFYGDMFGWSFDVMEGADYGIVSPEQNGTGGGIGAGPDGMSHQTFYVSVDDVQAALDQAESLGGTKVMGPMEVPGGSTIGMFTDPEGHPIGVVTPMDGQA
jgi:predicted enzyme related to lactoylglutathione lyase